MPLHAFDHINIHSEDIARLAEWYGDILGLRIGPRPDGLGVEGLWLYLGDQAILHLVDAPNVHRPGADVVPALEHIAFRATGLDEFQNHLARRQIDYTPFEVAEVGLVQINLNDCDGNHLHIDFPLEEMP